MPRIRTRKQRDDALREAIDAAVRATGGSTEPELPKVTISLHVAGHGEQEARWPCIVAYVPPSES